LREDGVIPTHTRRKTASGCRVDHPVSKRAGVAVRLSCMVYLVLDKLEGAKTRHLPAYTGAKPMTQSIDAAARRRVSGPGLRTFIAIADQYGIARRDRLSLLGEPRNSTYDEWVRKARNGAALFLPLDALMRISGVLGVHRSLCIVFPIRREALIWLKGPHQGQPFGGQSPLELMVDDGLDGIILVRQYLEAWRCGSHGASKEAVEPVHASDIVFS